MFPARKKGPEIAAYVVHNSLKWPAFGYYQFPVGLEPPAKDFPMPNDCTAPLFEKLSSCRHFAGQMGLEAKRVLTRHPTWPPIAPERMDCLQEPIHWPLAPWSRVTVAKNEDHERDV
ncbi:uncharacterized protein PADG_00487 [Paracoccidioides brasiliensis Pb18]|uniref:Uncharacterized protein n=1 Tax=Paracoccidioides brasiliensis (strain Pb18) TaxID=502780 RepID=C1G0U7_PARBD|nr:uncharacterized protein PADG_00487 [Paracoccidioides brasiliensis Pb18]EEH44198.2 hypothetical protein PADG_00487 [Paracoccidioides brasiliensis Pb18]